MSLDGVTDSEGDELPSLGKCRFCADDTWGRDEEGPVHPCCAIHAVENPGQPCLACVASRIARRRWEASQRHS